MGNQRKHKKARETKEALKNGAGTVTGPALASTSVAVKEPLAQAPTSVALAVVEKSPAIVTAPIAVAAKTPPAPTPAMTKAGVREYNDFFGLFAKSVRERKTFRPLGFIPGPAVLVGFQEGGDIQIVAATPDVATGLKTIPTPWMKWEELPEKIRKALEEWKTGVDGIGYEPSPYNFGFARGLLEGRIPPKFLAMTMPHFRYRPGDLELPFGVVLTPTEGGMKVKIFNPRNIPDVPKDDTVMTFDELKNSRGPIQKLLRTWALMEGNFLGRYDREGNPRPANGQPQTPNHKPTL